MGKVLFFMKNLNVSQSRFTGITHKTLNAVDLSGKDKGIESATATTTYEVIKVRPYQNGGYANTIHYYDSVNDITIALTHDNDISDMYEGKKIYSGQKMYDEGTTGYATGNHIHIEVARGKQTTKPNDGNGNYALPNLMNIEDYFYIDSSINVLDTKGINFEYIEGNSGGGNGGGDIDNSIVFDRSKRFQKLGKNINIVLMFDGEKMTTINSNQNPRGINGWDIQIEGVELKAFINSNYFKANVAQSEYGQILGRYQGVKNYGGGKEDERPNQPNVGTRWDVAVYEDMGHDVGRFESWNNEIVRCGFSIGACLKLWGVNTNADYSSTFGISLTELESKKDKYSFLGKLKNSKRWFMVYSENLSPFELRTELDKSVEYDTLLMLDGGASTTLWSEGNAHKIGRSVPNVIAFIKDDQDKTLFKEDTKPLPTLTVNPDSVKVVKGTTPDYTDGVIATDYNNNVLSVEVDSSFVNINVVGIYTVFYKTTDSEGQSVGKSRIYEVIDEEDSIDIDNPCTNITLPNLDRQALIEYIFNLIKCLNNYLRELIKKKE